MDIYDDIYKWICGQPDWLRDATRRVVSKDELSETDYQEILMILEGHNNVPSESGKAVPTPIPIRRDDFIVPKSGGPKVVLNKLHNVRNVNALASEQTVYFGSEGITIIYGENASGKSGYARVLKRACRSRDENEKILPDVYQKDGSKQAARANFDFEVNGEKKTDEWIDGVRFPENLKEIAVFDSKCARLFIDKDDKISYIPYGLDIFQRLASLCENLKKRIEAKKETIAEISEEFSTIFRETKTGQLISNLNWETSYKDVTDLASLNQTELLHLKKLTDITKTENPQTQSDNLIRLKNRIERFIVSIDLVDNSLSEKSVNLLKQKQIWALSAKKVAETASKEMLYGETLLGVGTDPWKEMFYAAQRFSQLVVYPDKDFPFTEEDSRCVLCQQPLDTSAKERLKKFWAFIISDVQKQSEMKKAEFDEFIRTVDNVSLKPESPDPEFLDEIGSIDRVTRELVLAYIRAISPRIAGIKEACDKGNWPDVPLLPECPSPMLKTISEKLQERIKELQNFISERARIETELLELQAREYLSKRKNTILNVLRQVKVKHYCDECVKCLNTRNITETQNELMEKAITSSLREKLSKELKELSVDYTKLYITNRGEKGKTLFGLQIPEGNTKGIDLSEILSEGEQRAAAIASFLSEIEVTGFQSGIVFDDPVSSLDHKYRERVAKRLVMEAKTRQVIVFTHDIVFLLEIVECAKRERVGILPQTIERTKKSIGKCIDEIPWQGKKTTERIGDLRSLLRKAREAYDTDVTTRYSEIVGIFYDKLRTTWERLVEEQLFFNTILRFRDSVDVKNLDGVEVTDSDFDKIYWGWANSSKKIPGHDRAAAAKPDLPLVTDMEKDIHDLEEYFSDLKRKNKIVEKRREMSIKPIITSHSN